MLAKFYIYLWRKEVCCLSHCDLSNHAPPPHLSLSLSLPDSDNGNPLMKSGTPRWSSTYNASVIEQFCQKKFNKIKTKYLGEKSG